PDRLRDTSAYRRGSLQQSNKHSAAPWSQGGSSCLLPGYRQVHALHAHGAVVGGGLRGTSTTQAGDYQLRFWRAGCDAALQRLSFCLHPRLDVRLLLQHGARNDSVSLEYQRLWAAAVVG